jgi:predicted membrane protein
MNIELSDRRESSRRCREIYENFSDSEKMYFNSITKELTKDCRKIEWSCWLINRLEIDIKKAELQLRHLVIGLLIALIFIWGIMFFSVLGKNYANYVVLILLYLWIAIDVIHTVNLIPNLKLKQSEISIEKILAEKSIIEIDRNDFLIRDALEDFVETIEKEGLSAAEEIYMPNISEGIALLIKNKHCFAYRI